MEDQDLQELNTLIHDAENCPRLNDFERQFLADLNDRLVLYDKKTRITDKQQEIIDRIERKVYAT